MTETVQQATTMTVVSSNNWPTVGEALIFTATVSVVGINDVPLGTVTFLNGSTILGTATLHSGGTATLNTSAPPVMGSYSITAVYGGDSSTASFTSDLNLTVYHAGPALTVTSSAPLAVQGEAVTFTATPAARPATGTVTFLDDGTVMGTSVFSGGVAKYTTSTLSPGTDAITAFYVDSTGTLSVSDPEEKVQGTTLTTTLSPLHPLMAGQTVTLTATVVGTATVPTGTITFENGNTILGTALLNAKGTARFTTPALSSGNYIIKAVYTGGNFPPDLDRPAPHGLRHRSDPNANRDDHIAKSIGSGASCLDGSGGNCEVHCDRQPYPIADRHCDVSGWG